MSSEICLITSIYPPESGGPAKFTFEFANWLAEQGIKVKVITYSNFPIQTSQPGIEIIVVNNQSNLLSRNIRMSWAIWLHTRNSDSILVAGAFIESGVVNLFGKKRVISKIPGDIVWERARNNKITNLDILEFQNSNLPWNYAIFRFLFQRSIRKTSRVIAPSNFINELVHSWGVRNNRIQTIYNSVNTVNFANVAELRKSYDVLTVARLVPWKGVAELIEVCSHLDLNLCVVGTGPELQNLLDVATRTNARVDFLGRIDPDRMASVYSLSGVFVLNSSYEGLPHVLIEARAAGLVTIAKAGTGSEEVINDGIDGLLVGDGSGRTLMEALRWTHSHPQECEEFKKKALGDLKIRFDQERNFGMILRLLEGQLSDY